MSTVTPADLRIEFPEFASLSDDLLQRNIDRVYRELDTVAWGVRLDDGALYLIAHNLTLARRRGAGGQLTGEAVGGVSRQFAQPQIGSSPLASTAYGTEYERIRNSLVDARFFIDSDGITTASSN